MTDKESECALKLKQLGFKKWNPGQKKDSTARYTVEKVELEEDEGELPSTYDLSLPCFAIISGIRGDKTIAFDIAGQAWKHPSAAVDLSHLGFNDAFQRKTLQ